MGLLKIAFCALDTATMCLQKLRCDVIGLRDWHSISVKTGQELALHYRSGFSTSALNTSAVSERDETRVETGCIGDATDENA